MSNILYFGVACVFSLWVWVLQKINHVIDVVVGLVVEDDGRES
jgi:hypothetical protein